MTAAIYFLASVMICTLVTHAWWGDRADTARRTFLAMGWTAGLAYACQVISFLPHLHGLRTITVAASALAAGIGLEMTAMLVGQPLRGTRRLRLGVTIVVATTAGVWFAWSLTDAQWMPWSQGLTTVWLVTLWALAVRHLWRGREAAHLLVERSRHRYFLVAVVCMGLLTAIEQAVRALGPVPDPSTLPFFQRGLQLQGALPPVSSLATVGLVYFGHHTLTGQRLASLQQRFSELAVVLTGATALMLLDTLVLAFVEFAKFPLHASISLFLATAGFLMAWPTLRPRLQRRADRAFREPAKALEDAVRRLSNELPSRLEAQAIADTLVQRLYDTGRVISASVWLLDESLGAFNLTSTASVDALKPLQALAPDALLGPGDLASAGAPGIAVARHSHPDKHDILGAMHADLAVPIEHQGVQLGWLAVRDASWSDGFSYAEVGRLQRVAQVAGLAVHNLTRFRVLAEAQRLAALGTLSAGLAHEIRNPLAGLKGAAQVLNTDDLDEASAEMVEVICDEVDRLDQVVRQFLDYARPFALRARKDSINVLAAHAVTLMRAQGLPDGIALIEDLSGDVPAVPIDSPRLTQVVLNLLQNALDAASSQPPGDGSGTVRLSTSRQVDAVVLEVHDSGPGISASVRAELFTPFFTTKTGGTGLGLPICKRLVEAHGGRLQVGRSSLGGAAFSVRLPIPEVAPAA